MKMKMKLISLALTVALLCGMSATVFAADPTGTGAAGNLLDYAIDTVVVPTTLKMTLNPNGYDVTTKYVKATTYSPTKTYYTDKTGATKATVANATAFAAGTFYEAVTSNAQVVSFNYGIVSKATTEQKVTISLAANYTSIASGDAITFVDSAAKAQAYDETTNADGAKRGELKIYLAAVAASALPTADTYKKTTDETVSASKTYYSKSGSSYVSVASGGITVTSGDVISVGSGGIVYEATTTIGPEISADELADVTMTQSTASGGTVAFATGTTNKADAKFAFKLASAGYTVKKGEIIDFSTTMAQLGDKLELSSVSGVAAFTLTGAINPDANWTKSEASAITITPTYKIEDATGDETASGGYNQIAVAPPAPVAAPPSIATTTYQADGSDVVINVSLGSGNLAANGIAHAYCLTPPQDFLDGTAVAWNATANTVTVAAGSATWLADNNQTMTIVFSDTAETSVVITFTA